MIYTSIEYENNCFEGPVVKNWTAKILGVVDQWDKAIIILDHIWHKKRYKFCMNFYAFVFSKVREWCFDKVKIIKLKR